MSSDDIDSYEREQLQASLADAEIHIAELKRRLAAAEIVVKAAREAWDHDSTDLLPHGIKARLRDALAAYDKAAS